MQAPAQRPRSHLVNRTGRNLTFWLDGSAEESSETQVCPVHVHLNCKPKQQHVFVFCVMVATDLLNVLDLPMRTS